MGVCNMNLNTVGVAKIKDKNLFNDNNKNATKQLVGNEKEFRINQNHMDLCIIGNNNCIRIQHNIGCIEVIGNATRLKIQVNNGLIKFIGNDGRISLGSESKQQTVDYVGYNGLLKIVNIKYLNAKSQKDANATTSKENEKPSNAIYSDWKLLKERFQRDCTIIKGNVTSAQSMPSNQQKLVKHIDSIVINNSANITIS